MIAAIRELFDLDRLEGVVLGEGLARHLVREIRVDVADVRLALQAGHVGRSDPTREQLVPVNGGEECVSSNLIHSQPVVRVTLKQAPEEVGSVRAEAWHDLDVLLRDLAEDLVSRLVSLHRGLLERVDAADHLVQQHAQRPPIDRVGVPVSLDDLGREILRGAAERVGHGTVRGLLDLGQAEICKLQVTL